MKHTVKLDAFGKWLHKKGLTREQFARDAGVSYNTVTKWRKSRKPRSFFMKSLHEQFKDCPLFKEQPVGRKS